MSVNAGAEQEYEKRHNPIWPDNSTEGPDIPGFPAVISGGVAPAI
jgi:hypothetical protein